MARSEARVSLEILKREITITGGGLAGLSLAVALRLRDVPVTVQEAGSYPRHRVCGEFISGVSRDTLDFLGIARHFEDARSHCSVAWFENSQLIHRDQLKEPAIGISRYLLDDRLFRHVESLGATVRTGFRGKAIPADGLVWTAGRRPEKGFWIGLKAHVRGIQMTGDLEMHSGANGYAGLAGVEDGWTNICGLFRLHRSITSSPTRILTDYLELGGNQKLADRLKECEWRADSHRAVAGFKLGRQLITPGLLTLGDAESMIPPFTGNGMSMAFQAAEVAVTPLVQWARNEKSWLEASNEIRLGLKHKFRRRLTFSRFIHPILLNQSGRNLIRSFAASGLLPFQQMLATVR